ncbi:MAG: hypothetical protein GX206_02780 [Clostridiales bacterium]|nr:hypothetical protein [Clostridiales bacterium]
MTKGKESVERKIANNKNNQEAIGDNLEMRFKKSAHTKESAMLSGLGSNLESKKEQSNK